MIILCIFFFMIFITLLNSYLDRKKSNAEWIRREITLSNLIYLLDRSLRNPLSDKKRKKIFNFYFYGQEIIKTYNQIDIKFKNEIITYVQIFSIYQLSVFQIEKWYSKRRTIRRLNHCIVSKYWLRKRGLPEEIILSILSKKDKIQKGIMILD